MGRGGGEQDTTLDALGPRQRRCALAPALLAASVAWPLSLSAREMPPRLSVAIVPLLADDALAGGQSGGQSGAQGGNPADPVAGSAAGTTAAPPQQRPAPPSLTPRGLVDITAPLLVNDRLIGEITVRADATGQGDIDAQRLLTLIADLLDSELKQAFVTKIGKRERVPLADMSVPPLSIIYDPATLEVRATVPIARLLARTVSARDYEKPDPSRFMPQARYAGGIAVGATQRFIESGPNKGRAPLLISTDGFLTVGAFPGVTFRSGGLFTEEDGGRYTFERAQTRLTYDSFRDAVHYVAGEFNPALTGFQGGAPLLGIGVARDYAGIRPFENIRPSGRGSITLDRPSTVIIEVNGLETRRLQLEPGRYQLTDLSGASGANDVRLFVQDDLGRREVAAATFFTATAMLAEGLTDFGAAIGKRESERTRYAGPVTATGYVRHGVNGNLTVGVNAQYAAGDWQAGGEAVVGTPIGLFRLQGTASDVAGRRGHAASLDWIETIEAGGSTWNFTLLSTLRSRNFASPFDRDPRINDEKWRIDGRADWRRGDFGATLVGSFARTRSRTEQQSLALTGYWTRGRLSLTATGGVEKEGLAAWKPRALIGLSYQLGDRSTASLRADTKKGAVVAELSRYPLDELDDLSGRLQLVRENDRLGINGDARYFGNRFIASIEQNSNFAQRTGGLDSKETILRASTFLGIADGSIALGRPPIAGFAIYDRHQSLDKSKVTVRDEAGLLIAKQDALGGALAPFNRAFSPVYQTFDVDPLPVGYDLGEGRLAAFPGAYSGYRVQVGSDASRVAVGILQTPEGPIVEKSGTVEQVDGKGGEPRPFFTNAVGRFAVDRLTPGTYRMVIDGVEVARFTVDAKVQGMIDVGTLAAKAP